MRPILAFAGAALMLCAGRAEATQIDFIWQATGTASITAVPGQDVVLELWVHAEPPGITGVAVSALATPGLLEAVGFEVCPLGCTGGFSAVGLPTVVLNGQNPGSPGGSVDPTPVPGLSGSFAALQGPPFPGVSEGSFVLAHVTYRVLGLGSGEVLPYYRAGVDGAVDVGSSVFVPLADGADITSGASIAAIPEPGTHGLLALGIGLLGGMARRSRTFRRARGPAGSGPGAAWGSTGGARCRA